LLRHYTTVQEELNRRDRLFEEELRQQNSRLTTELSERDVRLYKFIENRVKELSKRDDKLNKRVGRVGFRVDVLHAAIVGRLALLLKNLVGVKLLDKRIKNYTIT
jgi:hypothetical protein